MPDTPKTGLQHTPTGPALATHSSRSSIIARGRRDASATTQNPHYQQAIDHYNAGNLPAAAASFEQAANQGHAESQYILSLLYEDGEALPKDEAQSAHWEQKASEQGHAYAQANLSFRHYAAGDYAEAFAWCQRAAYSNLAWAQYHLGLMHRKGEGTPQSDKEAARWYRLAADQNHPEAQQKLAELYYFGQGLPLSHAQAAHWYRRAADQGNAEAQFHLGHLYSIGHGVDPDYTQSRHWTRQAALQGHDQALRELKRREYRDP